MDKELRIIAAEIIVSSKLTKSSKLQLLNFIKEDASDAQVKALLMDGEIVNLDEQGEQIVNDRFEVSEAGGRVAKLRKTYMSQAGSGGGLNPLWLAYRKIRSIRDECTRRCGKYELNTSRRQHCLIKCKVDRAKARHEAAKKADNKSEIVKTAAELNKAEALLKKSVASFQSRGADE
jgi:hypothetical protein